MGLFSFLWDILNEWNIVEFACLLKMIIDRNIWNTSEILKSTDASTDFNCWFYSKSYSFSTS